MPSSSRAAAPVRTARRGAAAAALAVLAVLAVAGCAKIDSALSRTWMDVSFNPETSVATVRHVRAVCSHVPNVTAAPLPRTKIAIDIASSLRYYTTNATNANVAQLQECVQKFPSVAGVTLGDSSEQGS